MKTDVDKISNIYSSMFCPHKRFAPRLAGTVKQMSMESSWVMLATLEPPNDIVFVHWQIPRKPLHSTPSNFYKQNFPHREDQRNVCTDFLRRTDFIQKNLHTEQLLHTFFFCTQKLMYTQGSFDRQTLLHTNAFTQRIFHTEQFLHTEAFTQSGFYTHNTQTFLHTNVFTQKIRCAKQLLDTNALSHRGVGPALAAPIFQHNKTTDPKLGPRSFDFFSL
jgi:hypothetical protein